MATLEDNDQGVDKLGDRDIRVIRDRIWPSLRETQAECRDLDPDIFFPERGTSVKEAKAVCAECSIRLNCLEHALDHGEKFGIWGGTSERQRRLLRPRYLQGEEVRVIAPTPQRNPEVHAIVMARRNSNDQVKSPINIDVTDDMVPKVGSQVKLLAYLAPFGQIGIRVQPANDIFALIADHTNTRVSELRWAISHLKKKGLAEYIYHADSSNCVVGFRLTAAGMVSDRSTMVPANGYAVKAPSQRAV